LNNNINNSINSDSDVNGKAAGINQDNSVSNRRINTPFDAPSCVLKLTIGLIGMFAFLQVYSIQS